MEYSVIFMSLAFAAFNTFDYKAEGLIRREDIKAVMNFVSGEEERSKGENSSLLQHEDEVPLTDNEKKNIVNYFG